MADSSDAFTSAAKSFSSPIRLPSLQVSVMAAAVASAPTSTLTPERDAPAAQAVPSSIDTSATSSPPSAGDAARSLATSLSAGSARPKLDSMLVRQITINQTQAVRALAHRAAGDMEAWRTGLGARQVDELFTYFAAFVDVASRSARANERVLAFLRASAAAAATFASAMHAAGTSLGPLATGEMMEAGNGAMAVRGTARAHGTSAVAAAVAEAHATATVGSVDFAASVSRMLAGDEGGPLGKATVRPVPKGVLAGGVPPPGDMAGLCSWYTAAVGELREFGSVFGAEVIEASAAAEKAFINFSAITGAHMSGEPKRVAAVKGACSWLAELRYRRACRALLAVKARYLMGNAALLDQFRRVERARGEAFGTLADAYAQLVTRTYSRVQPTTAVSEAVAALQTHSDLCRAADREARARITDARARATPMLMVPSVTAVDNGGSENPDDVAAPSFGAYNASSTSSTAVPALAAAATQPILFNLEPCPAVISPFASPLVVRCGLVYRQSGLMKAWTLGIGESPK